MHGRLKVKTTAEQQEAKKKEREKKLKLYNAAVTKAFSKRQNGEFDEEALHVTGELLAANSDFYTLWNFRKEIFLHLKKIKSKEELQALFVQELYFLESCLKGNPKSYGTWHHRCFVMETMPEPDWKRELLLCNQFLEYDERNFHCWDYRRFVVKSAHIKPQEEFEFTTNKISNNFSNYSSWHYRSKLLPFIFPNPDHPGRVQEEALISEYETVQNAFFTDPDDQSAWFYHRWLLGRGERKQGITHLCVSRESKRVTVSVARQIQVGVKDNLILKVNGSKIDGVWKNQQGRNKFSTLWIMNEVPLSSTGDVCLTVTLEETGCCEEMLLADQQMTSCVVSLDKSQGNFRHELSATTSDTLHRELESIKELFELEPENKWTVLTIVLLMRALDPLKFEEETLQYVDRLQELDWKRRNYYHDLKSKFIIENGVDRMDSKQQVLNLSSKKLTAMYHQELLSFVKELDISKNDLTSLKNFEYLQCIQLLNLDYNRISDCNCLRVLPELTELSIQNNLLKSTDSLLHLGTCPKLTFLKLKGNPVCNDEKFPHNVQKILPAVKLDY